MSPPARAETHGNPLAAPVDAVEEFDAVVLGAGPAGLYQLHQLREQGLRGQAIDAADDVGGTWWWYGYPGSRVDTEGWLHQYLFSRELYEQWGWSERYPAGYEFQRWLRFVADRLDLRRDIRLSTRVVSAHHDEERGRWRLRTGRGDAIDARYLVACVGNHPVEPHVAGLEHFAGEVLRTWDWPEDAHDLTGRRVGVLGVGTTGAQLVARIADRVAHLTVLVGEPRYVLPMDNPMYGWREREHYRVRLDGLAADLPLTRTGFEPGTENRDDRTRPAGDDGTLAPWVASLGQPPDPERTERVRDTMRSRLAAPELAGIVVPTRPFGPRRPVLITGYLEALGRDDVDVVDLRATPVTEVRPEGLALSDGTVHTLDVLVLGTDIDAGASALTDIDIHGRDGRVLADEWSEAGLRTTLGLAVAGYPNLFLPGGPLGPSVARANTTPCLQYQTEWVSRALRDLHADGLTTVEPTPAGQDAWLRHHAETAEDVGGPYAAGLDAYRRRCDAEASDHYPSFTRS